MKKIIAASALALVATLGSVGTAHADDQTYLADLSNNHVGTGIMSVPPWGNPSILVQLGHMMCDRMRGGMSPADAAQLPRGPGIDGMGIVGAAQHDICPDTLK